MMNIVGIIPARYQSTRFPGKSLMDICGKPMIQHVYERTIQVKELHEVYVAADDERIYAVCEKAGIPYLKTKDSHTTHVSRIQEVSERINADYYMVVCGDEPLITPEVIRTALPSAEDAQEFYVGGLCRYLTDPAEVIDPANIKVATNEEEDCILLTRSPVPFPYKTVLFQYKKVVGVECYNKKALDYFVKTPKGILEKIEDVTLLRFLENKIHIKYRRVNAFSLSVDTPRDLEKVREIMRQAHGYKSQ